MKTLLRSLIFVAASSLTLVFGAPVKTLTLIYTGDLHGELLASPDWTLPGDPKPLLGGLDRLATLIKAERASGDCLVLDAGDFARGSPEAQQTRGMTLVDLLSQLGYDAICVGERDIPYVCEKLDTIARHARFRLLGERALSARANVDMPVTRPSLLKEVGGIKVGLVGVLDEALIEKDSLVETSGLSPEQILEREIKALSSQNAEIIIVLAHMTTERCRKLASKFPTVTAFICAHEGWVVEPANPNQANLPLILAAGRRGQRVGICRISLAASSLDSARHTVVGARSRIANLMPGRAQPDSIVNLRVGALLAPGLADSLGFSQFELTPSLGEHSPLGQWVAENIRAQTNALAAVLPFSVLDAALLKGTVTERMLRRIVPYDDPLVRVRLTAADVEKVLDEALAASSLAEGYRPLTAGVGFQVVRSDSARPRVTNVQVRKPATGSNVVLTRALAIRAGLPSQGYEPVKGTLTQLLVDAVKQRGIIAPPASDSSHARVSATNDKVNVNTAGVEELVKLPGIGPGFAQRIVQYRQQHGPFRRIEDLMNVKGIAKKRFERIRERITTQAD
jgi:competence ComEA-like helix-hairpin-helix protein